MNKRILILAIIAALVIAYVIMRKETQPVQTQPSNMPVADVIAEDEMNGEEMPIPDAVEEVIVVDQEMPDPEEVAPIDEEIVPGDENAAPNATDENNQQPAPAQ